MIKILSYVFFLLGLSANLAQAAVFPDKTSYEVCFTPGENCTRLITEAINQAKQSVYVQAYSFTSAPIAKALVDAKKRGVDVLVVLDKSQIKNNHYSAAKFLENQSIPLWIDSKPTIAHNKVIIIDSKTVITGSFNFTKAAQEKNAENVLLINSSDLSNRYLTNFFKRKSFSEKVM